MQLTSHCTLLAEARTRAALCVQIHEKCNQIYSNRLCIVVVNGRLRPIIINEPINYATEIYIEPA